MSFYRNNDSLVTVSVLVCSESKPQSCLHAAHGVNEDAGIRLHCELHRITFDYIVLLYLTLRCVYVVIVNIVMRISIVATLEYRLLLG